MVVLTPVCTTQQLAWVALVTLGIGTSTLGGGTATLGRWVVIRAEGFAQSLFLRSFALATSFFANAIFVKSSLTLVRASAVSLPAGMLPWSAMTRCGAAATTWDSGEFVGLVMYWCLDTMVSLILVSLVLVTFPLKHWWCSMDVPRLKPGSDLVSHDR